MLLLILLALLLIALIVSMQGWTMLFAIIGLCWTVWFAIHLIIKGLRKAFGGGGVEPPNAPLCHPTDTPCHAEDGASSSSLPDDVEVVSSEAFREWMEQHPKAWRVKGS